MAYVQQKADVIAHAMLTADGLTLNSKDTTAPKLLCGDQRLATFDEFPEKFALEVRAVAFDSVSKIYKYCCIDLDFESAKSYLIVKENCFVDPTAKIGEKIKIRGASDTVLTAKITGVAVTNTSYSYFYEITNEDFQFFQENEIVELRKKAIKDRRIQRAVCNETQDLETGEEDYDDDDDDGDFLGSKT